jgi:hypothetical protein
LAFLITPCNEGQIDEMMGLRIYSGSDENIFGFGYACFFGPEVV